jgi:UPF0271 protein
VSALDRSLILYAPPGSELLRAGLAAGLRAAAEGFADRAYEPDGSLRSRREPDAVLDDPEVVVPRALRLLRDRSVAASNGATLTFDVDTLCLHGDTPGAGELAARLRSGLEAAGVAVRALDP